VDHVTLGVIVSVVLHVGAMENATCSRNRSGIASRDVPDKRINTSTVIDVTPDITAGFPTVISDMCHRVGLVRTRPLGASSRVDTRIVDPHSVVLLLATGVRTVAGFREGDHARPRELISSGQKNYGVKVTIGAGAAGADQLS